MYPHCSQRIVHHKYLWCRAVWLQYKGVPAPDELVLVAGGDGGMAEDPPVEGTGAAGDAPPQEQGPASMED